MTDLGDIRAMARKHGGKIGETIAALCDEVERLREPQRPPSDLGAIRRMVESDAPIPPRLVQQLCDRVEQAEQSAASFQRLATHAEARRMADKIGYELLLDAACAWDAALDRCDGIVAAEERLREALRLQKELERVRLTITSWRSAGRSVYLSNSPAKAPGKPQGARSDPTSGLDT